LKLAPPRTVAVPSQRRTEPRWQYAYGHKVRLAQRTDALRLLRAFASGAVYYDPASSWNRRPPGTRGPRSEPVSRGIEEHRRALRDSGDSGALNGRRLHKAKRSQVMSRIRGHGNEETAGALMRWLRPSQFPAVEFVAGNAGVFDESAMMPRGTSPDARRT